MLTDLSITPIAETLRGLAVARRSGDLQIRTGKLVKIASFDHGRLVFAASNLKKDRLGEALLALGRITDEEFTRVSALMKGDRKRRFGEALIAAGVMDKDSSYSTNFGVLEFTTEELLKLLDVEQRFLLTASLITNDVRFHWSLMVRAKNNGRSEDVRVMQLVRDFWTLRKLSSVIYEADRALNGLVVKSDLLREIVESGNPIVPNPPNVPNPPSGGNYMELAGHLRNRSAYHYGVGDLVKNIKNFDVNAKHIFFAHEQHGNSISALCEQIVTLPAINNAFEGANIDDFHAWCRSCSNSILHFCNVAISKIISLRMPEKRFSIKQVVLDQEAQPPDHRWPLHLIVEKKIK